MSEWYYGRDGQQAGPVSSKKLRELAEAGDLRPTDLVWKEGLPEWVAATKVKGLFPKGERISKQSGIPIYGSDVKTVTVACLNCKARYKVDEAAVIGNRVTCKACGNRIIVRAEEEQVIQFPLPERIATTRELSDDEIAIVRHRLTAFARDIPHHDIEDFGMAITLAESRFVPCYRNNVKTLYERRAVERRESPYMGQDIPPSIVTEDNAAPWSYEFVNRTDFEQFQDERRLDDSQSVHDCGDCSKSGQVTCPDCSGHGQVQCPQCSGSTAVACPQCSGRGAITQTRQVQAEKKCFACRGTGRQQERTRNRNADYNSDKCYKCYGRGFSMGSNTEFFDTPCNYCRTTGQVQCGNCNATGAVTCSTCQGNTYITCPRCEGRTQLVSFLTVVRNLDPAFQSTSQFDGAPEELIQRLLDERISGQTNIPIVETAEGVEIMPSLAELPQSAAVTVLSQEICQLLTEASVKANDECRIVWQSVEILQTIAATIGYQFSDSEYEAWIVGRDADLLPLRTPFSDMAQSAMETAISAWANGEKQRAIENLCCCRAMAANDQSTKAMLDENAERIPVGLKTAAAANSAMVSAKATMFSAATSVSDAVDAVKNSTVGKWFQKLKDGG